MVKMNSSRTALFLIIFGLFQLAFSVLSAFPPSRKRIGRVPLWNATLVDKLKQDLLLNYDKFARPTQHTNVTTVRFGMEIKHVEVNEFKSTVTIVGWTRLVWSDDKLKWETENYGGVGMFHVAPHEIWQPDLVLQNSATTTGVAQDSVYLLVYNAGEILWVPTSTFPILCEFNFEMWPFDQHRCKLIIGSWTYHSDHIHLEYDGNELKKIVNVRNSDGVLDWNITDFEYLTNSRDFCCGNFYPTLVIKFTLQRITNSYKSLILTPLIEEKILLNLITISVIVALMLYFAQKLPALGNNTPLIVKFYASALIITTLSIINAVLIIYLSKTPRKYPIPWILRNVLIGRLGIYLGLSNYITQANLGNQRNKPLENQDSFHSGKYQEDWILLAAAIDRISFLIYTIIFIILISKHTV
ncbi:acetylcholine receptor subunit alpha-L1-like isoform X2 [Onthophagus taurus]|uniref:acetylcholine receptor subunit alpha-L1-like isoform X2 n=1 Tax=Onthophagus taurus TaxID=166361 RepID=UPI000C209953|nr:acetylcholine receptor subunit alpha-L1-like isoform X2 [Onthophagus taurus]